MKDTTTRGPEFRPQFCDGAVAFRANTDGARHGAEMDAPHLLPTGCMENVTACDAYPWPRQGCAER